MNMLTRFSEDFYPTKLIDLSDKTGLVIITDTRERADFLFDIANEAGLEIRHPIPVKDLRLCTFHDEEEVLVDNAGKVLQKLLGHTIHTLMMY